MRASATNKLLWRAVGAAAIIGAMLVAQSARASTWTNLTATTDLWSISANWDSGVPNGIGAIANFTNSVGASTIDVTNDVSGGITLGTLQLTGTPGNNVRLRSGTITNDNSGVGGIISNSTTRQFAVNPALVLADNLLVASTGSGQIMLGAISGTGNVTIDNANNSFTNTAASASGATLLSSSSSFIGNVLIRRGAVGAGNFVTTLGNSANAVTLGQGGYGAASFMLNGSGGNILNPITVASGSGGTLRIGTSNTGSGTNIFGGAVTLNDDLTLYCTRTGVGMLRFTNVISGAGGIVIGGTSGADATSTGLVQFTAANTYQGATTINSGTLALGATGGITNSSGVAVASGATFDVSAVTGGFVLGVAKAQTLSGSGIVTGSLTVASGSTLAPGNSPGLLTLQSGLTLKSNSVFALDINGPAQGSQYDAVLVAAGTLSVSNSLLTITSVSGVSLGMTFDIVSNMTGSAALGLFTDPNTSQQLTNNAIFTAQSTQFQINYSGGAGNDILLTVVPEPSAFALAGLGALLGIGLWRRQFAVTFKGKNRC